MILFLVKVIYAKGEKVNRQSIPLVKKLNTACAGHRAGDINLRSLVNDDVKVCGCNPQLPARPLTPMLTLEKDYRKYFYNDSQICFSPQIFCLCGRTETKAPIWLLIIHDWSKFLPDEFFPYAQYFYGEDLKLKEL